MWRRYVIPLLLVLSALFLLGIFPGRVAAQERDPSFASFIGKPASLQDMTALFKRAPVPAQINGLEGPESLEVGEEGHFSAHANIEVASLPLRSRWDFGDGTTANGLHHYHRFEKPGTYLVTFTLSNEHGESTDSLSVTVVPTTDRAKMITEQFQHEHDPIPFR